MSIFMRLIKRILWAALVTFIASIIFSLLFPGKVKIVDSIRMFAQKPVLKWAGKIKMEDIPIIDNQPKEEGVDITYDELLTHISSLSPGAIFFTRTRNYALSEFIPGMWMHTGIFLGTKKQIFNLLRGEAFLNELDTLMNDSDIYILDSYAEGVDVRPFSELSNMQEKSYLTHFASFSIKEDKKLQSQIISNGLNYLGREYDYDWITEDDETIFCSELLYHTLQAVGINIQDRTTTVSREIFTPDNLFQYLLNNSGKDEMFIYNGTVFKGNDTTQIRFPI